MMRETLGAGGGAHRACRAKHTAEETVRTPRVSRGGEVRTIPGVRTVPTERALSSRYVDHYIDQTII